MPALYVTGALSAAAVEAAFSGRLQIHNAQGACWAELIDGELPKGYSITVDNDTSEVVVAWPAYSSGEVTLTNGDFESGAKGWNLGPGWSLTDQASAYSGQWCAQWSGSGNSQILSDWVPIVGGTTTSLSVEVQQGASSSGNVGAQCVIEFRDADKQPIEGGVVTGNMVASGSGGDWHPSTLTNVPVPSAAACARAGGSAYRKRETKPAWLDAVQWTWNVGEQGANAPTASTITIRVHDAAGRYADWTGLVQIGYLILTSWLYPINVVDDADSPLATGGSVNNLYGLLGHDDADSPLATGGSVIALSLTATVIYGNHDQPQDDADSVFATGGSVQALALTETVSYGTYSHAPEDADSPIATGGSVIALSLVVTTSYQTYAHAQDDADSPLGAGGSVINLSLT